MKQALAGISDKKLLEIIETVNAEFNDILIRFKHNVVRETPKLEVGEHVIEAVTFYDEEKE